MDGGGRGSVLRVGIKWLDVLENLDRLISPQRRVFGDPAEGGLGDLAEVGCLWGLRRGSLGLRRGRGVFGEFNRSKFSNTSNHFFRPSQWIDPRPPPSISGIPGQPFSDAYPLETNFLQTVHQRPPTSAESPRTLRGPQRPPPPGKAVDKIGSQGGP